MINFKKQRENLLKKLKKEGRIYSEVVENAFLKIPRELFVSNNQKHFSYIDSPLDIGFHQTISAPHMVAIMVEAMDIREGQKILEIGTGSGYHAAIVSSIVGKKGYIYSIERIKSLAEIAKNNLQKAGIENVKVIVGDGSIGLEQNAPFDHIYVTCGAPFIPQPLIKQLRVGGSLLIPVGDRICELQKIIKKNGDIEIQHLGACAFVPLIGKHGYEQ
jgi:protein-L-isoaspartate(D-aspartate) O-methyltransferase